MSVFTCSSLSFSGSVFSSPGSTSLSTAGPTCIEPLFLTKRYTLFKKFRATLISVTIVLAHIVVLTRTAFRHQVSPIRRLEGMYTSPVQQRN